MAPVELIGLSRRKAQRDVGRSGRLPALLAPSPGVTPHGVVTTVIAAPAQLFEDPDQRQLLASGLGRVPCQQSVEFCCPPPQLWPRLYQPLVLERGLSRPQHLPDREKMLAPYPGNRLHNQHPQPPASLQSRQRNSPIYRGSIFGRRSPPQGVNFACRMTADPRRSR